MEAELSSPCSDIVVKDNIAAGSFQAGFCTYTYDCSVDAVQALEYGNVAHSSRFGAWVQVHDITCGRFGGITVYKTVEVGLALNGKTSLLQVDDVISADNLVGIQVGRTSCLS